jgi:hypothetical protein
VAFVPSIFSTTCRKKRGTFFHFLLKINRKNTHLADTLEDEALGILVGLGDHRTV